MAVLIDNSRLQTMSLGKEMDFMFLKSNDFAPRYFHSRYFVLWFELFTIHTEVNVLYVPYPRNIKHDIGNMIYADHRLKPLKLFKF